MCNDLKKKEILLLIIYSVKESCVEGRTRLTKLVFLFQKEYLNKFIKAKRIKNNIKYLFSPHKYGPYSKDIYDDIEFFVRRNFMKISIKNFSDKKFINEKRNYWQKGIGLNDDKTAQNKKIEKFSLSENGIDWVKSKIMSKMNEEQNYLLTLFTKKVNKLTTKELLKYIYNNYIEYTSNSIIKEDILN